MQQSSNLSIELHETARIAKCDKVIVTSMRPGATHAEPGKC